MKQIDLSGDRSIFVFPGEKATLTDADDRSHSVTLNVTGSFHETTLENGNVVTEYDGRNLLFDPDAGFVLAIGHFSTIIEPDGDVLQPLEGHGQIVNVFDLLI